MLREWLSSNACSTKKSARWFVRPVFPPQIYTWLTVDGDITFKITFLQKV